MEYIAFDAHKRYTLASVERLSGGRLCEQWAHNHKRLKRILREMEQLSLKETDRILGAISRS